MIGKEDDKMNIEIEDPGKLISDGSSISSSAAEFQNEIRTIYGIIDDLKNSWTGESATRYTQNVESFRAEFENFAKIMGEFGELINAVGTDYQNLESEL